MNKILIYNMGRVGSVSVQSALKSADVPIMNAHWLQANGEYPTPKGTEFAHTLYSRTRTWKVVTLVRDPLERNISAFFRDLDKYHSGNNLVRSFVDNYPHNWPFRWFNSELGNLVDVRMMSYFPHYKGYEIYSTKMLRLLVLRTEDLTRVGGGALNNFIGVSVSVPHENKTKDDRILEFYEKARFPLDFLMKTYYNRVYTRLFYSDNEIRNAVEAWS